MNIVVTGAGKGIGKETVIELADKGHKVFALSRNIYSSDFPEHLQKNISILPFDLTKKDFTPLTELIKDSFNKIDGLINNAGVLIAKPFMEFTEKDFDYLFNVNVKAPFRLIQALSPIMSKNSHILNISSIGGFQGSVKFPGLSLYSAGKGALSILTESLAEELKEKDIRVNALALGATQTEMLEKAFPGYKAPLSAHKMAQFISYFILNGHHFFNGKILPVSLSTP